MNKDQVQGNWEEFKGKAKQAWAKLGDTDYKLLFEGKIQEFAGKHQAAYGSSKEETEKQIKEFEKTSGYNFRKDEAA